MPPGIGYQFGPSAENTQINDNGSQGQFGSLSPQQAVKILSLRIPQRRSDPSPIPLPLLQAGGGAGAGFGGGLNAFLQALMGAFSAKPGGGGGAPVSVGGPSSPPAAPLPGFVVPNQPQQPIGSPRPGGQNRPSPLEGAPGPLFNQPLF